MSKFSKITVLIIIVLSFFFIKEKLGFVHGFIPAGVKSKIIKVFNSFKSSEKNTTIKEPEPVKVPEKIIKTDEKLQTVEIYFLALDEKNNGIYKKVSRELPESENRFEYAIEELLKGPNVVEKTTGAYSEIPKETKLLGIKKNENRIIIDLSSEFQYGGGTDSIYSRMMQLIKTSVDNAENKKVYLYIDGKQIKFIGGEGIMISQPLSEKSLEI